MKTIEGVSIEIIEMSGESNYTGRVGDVKYIDDAGHIHGTWGGCSLIPDIDKFKVIKGNKNFLDEVNNE